MAERRYHVGQENGNGPIYRLVSRKEAQAKFDELTKEFPDTKFYLDGPEEPSEAERVSDLIKKIITEEKPSRDLMDRLMEAGSDEEVQKLIKDLPDAVKTGNQFILDFADTYTGKGLGKALKLALKIGMPLELAIALAVNLGYKAGLAVTDQERFERLTA